jgi:hypothetical protein
MGRGVKIPWIGVRYTMGSGVNIPWIGVGYTMGRGFNISWVGGSKYHISVIWYFDPHGILTPGSLFRHCNLNPLISTKREEFIIP